MFEKKNWEFYIGIILFTKQWTLFRFQLFSHQCPFSVPESNPGYRISFVIIYFYSLLQSVNNFPVLSCFSWLKVLKTTGQVCCRMVSSLGLSDVSLWLHWAYYRFEGRIPQWWLLVLYVNFAGLYYPAFKANTNLGALVKVFCRYD